ncbi:hypothetical protein AGMMS49992_24000 [Clostridia bacterium]|nr:hypothetical protein AGMMS49992_24000 [Clostridia bacterium]
MVFNIARDSGEMEFVMKRLSVLVLIIMVAMASSAFAESLDLSRATVEELLQWREQIDAKLLELSPPFTADEGESFLLEQSAVQEQPIETYVKTIMPAINLRKTPSISGVKSARLMKGTILRMINQTADGKGAIWYEVEYKGNSLFVRGDLVELTTNEEAVAVSSNPELPRKATASGGGKTTPAVPPSQAITETNNDVYTTEVITSDPFDFINNPVDSNADCH